MPYIKLLTQKQLLSIIQLQTNIVKIGLDIEAVMRLVTDETLKMTNAEGVAIELIDGDDTVYTMITGNNPSLHGLRLKRSASLSGLSIQENTIQYCKDIETDERVDREVCRKVGIRSMAIVPLLHIGEAIGVLKIFSKQIDAFGERDFKILSLIADHVAAVLYHSSKYGVQELYNLATRDHLTNLANRSMYLDCLRQKILKAKQNQQTLSILLMDMDELKAINDLLGHRFGDAALKEIAKRITDSVNQDDLVARIGGDEFAVILNSAQSRESAETVLRRILENCSTPFIFDGQPLKLGASIGLAVYPDDAENAESLLTFADHKMYQIKRKHKSYNL
ncbi:sensor domain-containing diguanylate cyclase [Acinetobacter stercoris]|uniref:Phytochrome-like protein cph2 n=1 Tax=Acinetobacter stercoris TaxID=2126983 RepID=A0A2U3MWW0_9GAMM|nr:MULTISPECIES: sensor domain-containing diguanylate cyclase [Acinetobacter]SPL69865.1 Phytochrome-like protein cph2 [Acinetobacter stercoris]